MEGTCQIPDPVYKLVGSIVCFYIPLGVMLITYCLTVRLLARQQQSLCGGGNNTTATGTSGVGNTTNGNQPNGWSSGWLGGQQQLGNELIFIFICQRKSLSFIFLSLNYFLHNLSINWNVKIVVVHGDVY